MPAKKGETDINYKGYTIRWTGWKSIHSQIVFAAQWIAYNGKDIICSDAGGSIIIMPRIEYCINTEYKLPQFDPIDIFSTAAEKEKRKQLMLSKMIEFIDALEKNNGESSSSIVQPRTPIDTKQLNS